MIDVWLLSLPSLPDLAHLLSDEERARADRLVLKDRRREFTARRGMLRTILSPYAGLAPEALRFEYGPRGKPSLPGGPCFNLAHSGDSIVYAIASDREVGVDIERLRPIDHELLARRFFATAESVELLSLPEEQRERAFFVGWTRKEAYVKARGLGMSDELDGFVVSLSDRPALLEHEADPDAPGRWAIRTVEVGDGYVGALAVAGDMPPIRYREFSA